MKRLALILITASLLGFGAFGQTLDGFKTAVSTFADSMAGTLALDSTAGGIWSQSYIGKFPHFGIGLTAGASFTGADAMNTIFTALGEATPDALKAQGIPIPTAAGTFRIGLPLIPADLAIKGMVLPQSAMESLKASSGVSAQIQNFGMEFRYSLVKESFWRPAVSFGVGGTYQSGSVSVPTNAGPDSITYGNYTIGYTDPEISLGWKSFTVDTSVQVSKTILLILTPYAGAGITFGKSEVTGGVDSAVSVTGTDPTYGSGQQGLENMLNAMNEPDPFEGQSTGFAYTATSTKPLVRLYAGLSINILVVFDAAVMYVPATKALGGTLTARVQL